MAWTSGEVTVGRKANIGITADYFRDGAFVVPGPGLALLDELTNVEYSMLTSAGENKFQAFDTSQVQPEQVANYDMVASIGPKWNAATFVENDRMLSVHRNGVGYDMVNVAELSEANVLLCTTPEAVKRPMAVVILTFLFLLSTRFQIKNRIAKEHRWSEISKYPGYGLVGKTFGCIGAGRIGREAFELARPLNMRHIAYDPWLTPEAAAETGIELVDLETVLSESDYLSISCPLNSETRHLIGAKQLAKMKPGAFLINIARGSVIDETALIDALRRGRIQGAALDVFEAEPPAADNPLLVMDNVVVTPHSMGWTDQSVMGIWKQIVGQMKQIMNGEKPSGLINSDVWGRSEFQTKLKRFRSEIG
jgi:phosphoglycerate dehydrogenase-like enzyme